MKMSLSLSEIEITRRLQAAYQPLVSSPTDDFADSALQASGMKLKCAAVLIPMAFIDQEWQLVFTRRTDSVESHKGQVSFPGGGCNENETQAEQTALREAEEEVGLNPLDVKILGRLNDVATITHFRVTPVVGIIPWPYGFRLSQMEVNRVFSIPINWMAQPSNWEELNLSPQGNNRTFPVIRYHPFDGEVLWGATARIVHNFLEVLGLIHLNLK